MSRPRNPRQASRDVLDSVATLGGVVTIDDLVDHTGRTASSVRYAGAWLVKAGQLQRVDERPASWRLHPASTCLAPPNRDRCHVGQGGYRVPGRPCVRVQYEHHLAATELRQAGCIVRYDRARMSYLIARRDTVLAGRWFRYFDLYAELLTMAALQFVEPALGGLDVCAR